MRGSIAQWESYRTRSTVKPFLKWAGGKRQLLPEIRRSIPSSFRTYYEPFLGAGAVLFDLQPAQAVVNDFNDQLMLTYRAVRDDVEQLISLLEVHKLMNSSDYFYEVRGLDRNTASFGELSHVEKAARLIYLNKTCYNGLYRVNSQGLFNVPYGRYKNPLICEADALRAVSFYLREHDVALMCGDFSDVVGKARPGDFVYFDPPYHSANSTNFTSYQAGGFSESEQERLRDVFAWLTERGVKCLLSNSDTGFIRALYGGFTVETVSASRAINADSSGRGKVNEVLIRNW